MNVAGECARGGVTEGGEAQEFPLTWLILHLLYPFAESPPPHMENGLFCL